VCGGFAMPMREGFAREIYIVTSGEMMAIYAANNICKAVKRFSEAGVSIQFGGLICNSRNTFQEEEVVTRFADKINSRMLIKIPRAHEVQISEAEGTTVIETVPDSGQARIYRNLATQIMNNSNHHIPVPMNQEELKAILKEYAMFELGQNTGAPEMQPMACGAI
ncbi:MAG: hypothetical protein OEM02_10600, partial [Desulfobulbaceae bacterium]|nr:hypothetical protein [Desulfobulbaceae bacterium]